MDMDGVVLGGGGGGDTGFRETPESMQVSIPPNL